ncbi:hypothetical protein [Embleya sp. MST-111070]|uniref:hypothetical protein n=1 Tax=Embleya sp. MST-111070 TaxID=3398231 RepID=UPI003F735D93
MRVDRERPPRGRDPVQQQRAPTTAIDPRLAPERREAGDLSMGVVLIDACKPFAWKDRFPAANRFDEATRESLRRRWKGVLPL